MFTDIPIAAGTTATLLLSSIDDMTLLALDIDGDGTDDVTLVPGESLSEDDLLSILSGIIQTLEIPNSAKDKLATSIVKIQRTLDKDYQIEGIEEHKLEQVFDKIIKTVEKLRTGSELSEDEANELISVIEVIREGVL